ncbi:MAG: carbohydrate kinase [Oscillospiraceae bacterium]|nr:carbohydrate kinase [Oscillospiraceae bacterium]
MKVVTSEQMKQIEACAVRKGMSSYHRLMENAGSAAFKAIIDRVKDVSEKSFVILSGSGNNGGDGFVVTRKLFEAGAVVTVVLCCGFPKTEQSKQTFELLQETDILIVELDSQKQKAFEAVFNSDVIVDAVFGTGFKGKLPFEIAEILAACNKSKAKGFALDISSGAKSDSNEFEENTFVADYTITFDSAKPFHIEKSVQGITGEVVLAAIGIDESCYDEICFQNVIDKQMVKSLIKKRKSDAHKGDFGKLLCVCGSVNMSGAAVMSSLAALRSGAGLVTIATPKSAVSAVASHIIEGIFLPLDETTEGTICLSAVTKISQAFQTHTAAVIGCGLSLCKDTISVVQNLVSKSEVPLLIDADGLNAISRDVDVLKTKKAPLILTPHLGEMSRLCKKEINFIKENKAEVALKFARQYDVVVVLKGENTVVASPNGEVFINTTGNPGMARGGSGDVLSGMIGAFLAQGMEPQKAALCGVYLHGLSGDLCAQEYSELGMLPTDMIKMLPAVFKGLEL